MSIIDRLDEIEDIANSATPGPWTWEATSPSMSGAQWHLRTQNVPGIKLSVSEYQHGTQNAEFITAARVDVPELVDAVRQREAALRAILELHRSDGHEPWSCGEAGCSAACVECEWPFPCPTFLAASAAIV